MRAEAYGRAAEYREKMLTPDDVDASLTAAPCEDKIIGDPVGTMRIQTTVNGGALEIEKYATVPSELKKYGQRNLATIGRLSR